MEPERSAAQGSVLLTSACWSSGSVDGDVDLVARREPRGEEPCKQFGEPWRHAGTDDQRHSGPASMIIEIDERLDVVEIVAHRHHTDAAVEESDSVWCMWTGVREHDDIECTQHRARGSRVDVDDGDVSENGAESAGNPLADDSSPDQPDGDHQRSGSSSGRQPPCCGGVPPVPRTRMTVAVITIARIAASDRRTNFMGQG